jgi:hypothetical protein
VTTPSRWLTRYAELEIGFQRITAGDHQVELRFTDPLSEAAVPAERGSAALDAAVLLALQDDPRTYGEALTAQFFAEERVRSFYLRARTAVEASERCLRLRLVIGPSAPELHGLRWELLRDPETGEPLATSEKILFSRFLVSQDWRPVRLRRRAALRALIAVAAPSDCASYRLAEVDRDGEIARARRGLGDIQVTTLGGEREPLTLERLVAGLREGADIVYLVSHGALVRGQVPWLFLQDEEGKIARVEGAALAERLRELPDPPRLMVLASCESGGTANGATQAALAPRLAEAGVTAVVAMQGQITMETVEKAMPVFFSELGKDGQIDRALAVARGTVREHADSWMPMLSMRLKSGRIWYEPGFADEPGEAEQITRWRAIADSVRLGRCVPVLGPELGEHFYGGTRERANRLAAAHGFPLEPNDRSDLAKVTQYLAVTQSHQYARNAVADQLKAEIRRRHPGLENEPRPFEAIARRAQGEATQDDPFRILAGLSLPLYVTASPDPLLLLTLAIADRRPKALFCKWRRTRDSHPSVPPYEEEPRPESPVVYYPFGVSRAGEEASLVLTEDDFLDYLIAAAEYKLIPTVVSGTLVRSSLLFLGFNLDDLELRVLFRLIMSLEGSGQLGDHAHVGVQIDPELYSLIDVERAREYLEEYFGSGRDAPRIDIYWGTAADFLKELREHLRDSAAAPAASAGEGEDEWASVER